MKCKFLTQRNGKRYSNSGLIKTQIRDIHKRVGIIVGYKFEGVRGGFAEQTPPIIWREGGPSLSVMREWGTSTHLPIYHIYTRITLFRFYTLCSLPRSSLSLSDSYFSSTNVHFLLRRYNVTETNMFGIKLEYRKKVYHRIDDSVSIGKSIIIYERNLLAFSNLSNEY